MQPSLENLIALIAQLEIPGATIDVQAIKAAADLVSANLSDLQSLSLLKQSIRKKLLGKVCLTYPPSDKRSQIELTLSDENVPTDKLLEMQAKIENDFSEAWLKKPVLPPKADMPFTRLGEYRI